MSKKKSRQKAHPATTRRSVDQAMAAGRADKDAIRLKWLGVLKAVHAGQGAHPVYLTLPGAEGRDVQLLIDEGLIAVTETGAIAAESESYCVAVESSLPAVLELQERYPGLRILHQDIRSVLRGDSLVAYPDSRDRARCQAHVVNLDLQSPLNGDTKEGNISFPILRWIEKFGTLHLECSHRQWHLLLTLNGTIQWTDDVCKWVSEFLRDNFARVEEFRLNACRILGSRVFEQIQGGETIDFNELSADAQQKVLLVLVPKAIGYFLHRQGWGVTTQLNAEYRGGNGAPMVTYIFELSRASGQLRPESLYVETVRQSLTKVERVTEEGGFEEL